RNRRSSEGPRAPAPRSRSYSSRKGIRAILKNKQAGRIESETPRRRSGHAYLFSIQICRLKLQSAALHCATMTKPEWDIHAAITTYNVDAWGGGYFSINSAGNVIAKPLKDNGSSIDLLEVVNEARDRGLGFPLVIRFQDLLRDRVQTVNRSFQTAMQEF